MLNLAILSSVLEVADPSLSWLEGFQEMLHALSGPGRGSRSEPSVYVRCPTYPPPACPCAPILSLWSCEKMVLAPLVAEGGEQLTGLDY